MGVPQGSEFQINTYATLDQTSPSITILTTGDFVVVWASFGVSAAREKNGEFLGKRRFDASELQGAILC